MYICTHVRVCTHMSCCSYTGVTSERCDLSTTILEPRGPGEVRGGSKPTMETEAWSAGVGAVQGP